METTSITFNHKPSQPFNIRWKLDCTAKDIIYTITCLNCRKQYIGQTSNLRNRVTLHRQHNRDPNVGRLLVNRHLDTCNNGIEPSFMICPIIQKEDKRERELLETHLIHKYQPELNSTI